jgi:hypothetical protein
MRQPNKEEQHFQECTEPSSSLKAVFLIFIIFQISDLLEAGGGAQSRAKVTQTLVNV